MTDEENIKNEPLVFEVNGFSFTFVEYKNLRAYVIQNTKNWSRPNKKTPDFINQVTDDLLQNLRGKANYKEQLFLKSGQTPSDETVELLHNITCKIEAVEEKTGVTLPRNIDLNYAVNGINLNDKMLLSYKDLTDDDASFSRLENTLFHETSHVLHEDVEAFYTLLRCKDYVAPLALMVEIYQENPDLFYNIVADGYRGDVDDLEGIVDNISNGLGDYLAPITMNYPDIFSYSDKKVLRNMYDDSQSMYESLSEILPLMFKGHPNEMAAASSRLSIIFCDKIKDVIDNSAADEVTKNLHNYLTIEEPRTLSTEDKHKVDNMLKEKVLPILSMIEEVEGLYEQYSRATEYRCDDYMMAMSDSPSSTLDWHKKNYHGEGLDAGYSQAEIKRSVNMHPPSLARITRAEVFADMIEKAREENPDIDALTLLKTGSHTAKHLDREMERKLEALETKTPPR